MFISDTEYFKGKLISIPNTIFGYLDIIKYTKELISKFIVEYDKLSRCKIDDMLYSYSFMILNKLNKCEDVQYGDNLILEDNCIFQITLYYNKKRDIVYNKNEIQKIEFCIKSNTVFIAIPPIIINPNSIKIDQLLYLDATLVYYAKLLFEYFFKDVIDGLSNKFMIKIAKKFFIRQFERFSNHVLDKYHESFVK